MENENTGQTGENALKAEGDSVQTVVMPKKFTKIIVNGQTGNEEVTYLSTGSDGVVLYATRYGYGTTEENHQIVLA